MAALFSGNKWETRHVCTQQVWDLYTASIVYLISFVGYKALCQVFKEKLKLIHCVLPHIVISAVLMPAGKAVVNIQQI